MTALYIKYLGTLIENLKDGHTSRPISNSPLMICPKEVIIKCRHNLKANT